MTIGRDPRTLAIVILPKSDDDPTMKICLMNLDDDDKLNWDKDPFILARSTGVDGAATYSKELADILRIKVLQLV